MNSVRSTVIFIGRLDTNLPKVDSYFQDVCSRTPQRIIVMVHLSRQRYMSRCTRLILKIVIY